MTNIKKGSAEGFDVTTYSAQNASTSHIVQSNLDILPFEKAVSISGLHSSTNSRSLPEPRGSEGLKYIPDLVCLSHLRWDFVYQRPQHLLSRCARTRRVFFVEEPHFKDGIEPRMEVSQRDGGVWVAIPYLPHGLDENAIENTLKALLDDIFLERGIRDYILWYYTPMAIGFSRHLTPLVTVYDCMDELSAFKFAPAKLKDREAELIQAADLIFTGGQSLFEAKRNSHHSVHAFPSSVDVAHFAQARQKIAEPDDQKGIAGPRIGFFGVIDERMDLELLREIAIARPNWNLVIIGPVVKIDPASLPRQSNIHYLGGKNYKELPRYLNGWDIAILPFAKNESTQFISPTKTPEYLAAGKPVISTSIRDVVRPYGQEGLVKIADTPEEFISAAESLLNQKDQFELWLAKVDSFLANNSWDYTWESMYSLIEGKLINKSKTSAKVRTVVSSH